MTTKEWLAQGKNINKEIRALKDALEKAEKLYGSEKNEYTKQYRSVLSEKIDRLLRTNSDILDTIYKIDDNILRTLLIERFINNKTWELVSFRLGYDFYHVVKRLYPKAVAEVEKVKQAS